MCVWGGGENAGRGPTATAHGETTAAAAAVRGRGAMRGGGCPWRMPVWGAVRGRGAMRGTPATHSV
eukprot:366547-Chlamydomonas_euryale.AAC.4